MDKSLAPDRYVREQTLSDKTAKNDSWSTLGRLKSLGTRICGGLDTHYLRLLQTEVGNCCDSLLDVGCGLCSPVKSLSPRPCRLVGVDGFAPAVEQSNTRGIHDEYHIIDVMEITRVFAPRSFDCVLAGDIIEHLHKPDALELLKRMESLARRKVIVATPNGFVSQDAEYGNPLQIHLSGWTSKEMSLYGYRVIGIGGLRWIRGELGHIRWWPKPAWYIASTLTQRLLEHMPQLAFALLCVKDISYENGTTR
jgi:2-polyprenyl-3-methyl-5-hydroxy-6-metoxy-1,4-benzoquinol methylase